MEHPDFIGVKIALFCKDKLLVYLRDNKENLQYANMWDFPGGGRENNESPLECIIREVAEEFSIILKSDAILYSREYPADRDPSRKGYFMAANISEEDIKNIKFGDEGQRWQLMTPEEFLSSPNATPFLKGRLKDFLDRA